MNLAATNAGLEVLYNAPVARTTLPEGNERWDWPMWEALDDPATQHSATRSGLGVGDLRRFENRMKWPVWNSDVEHRSSCSKTSKQNSSSLADFFLDHVCLDGKNRLMIPHGRSLPTDAVFVGSYTARGNLPTNALCISKILFDKKIARRAYSPNTNRHFFMNYIMHAFLTVGLLSLCGDACAQNEPDNRSDAASIEYLNNYIERAKKGDVDAQVELASAFYQNEEYGESLKYLRMAAQYNNSFAIGMIGTFYEEGLGVAKNETEAARWWKRAADKGDLGAQIKMGNAYMFGIGVRQDLAQGVKWYRMAAERGNPYAQYYLGEAFARGDGIPRNPQQAIQWWTKAAEQGQPDAQAELGYLYLTGLMVGQDSEKGITLLRAAAKQGNKKAKESLSKAGLSEE